VIRAKGEAYEESLKMTLASGESVLRPMGLTDVPGGAATGGLYAALFGVAIFLQDRRPQMRALCLASMAVGLFCIYLSQTRSVLVWLGICLTAFFIVLAWRGDIGRLTGLIIVAVTAIVLSFWWAVSVGGQAVTGRMATLIERNPGEVYYENRGHFVDFTIDLLPEYPFGAGLGRWGMMNYYFGDDDIPKSYMIWVEIQWTGWLLDGGVPLILAYCLALYYACRFAWRVAQCQALGSLGTWAALVLAYSVGTIAVTFNYPVFIGQAGMEFWLINAGLFAAARGAVEVPPRPVVRTAS
jgi:hypothetical protein